MTNTQFYTYITTFTIKIQTLRRNLQHGLANPQSRSPAANRPDKLTVPPQPPHAPASAPPLGRVRTELIPAERASAMTSAMALWLRGAMM